MNKVFFYKDNITVREADVKDIDAIKDNILPEILEEIKASHNDDKDPGKAMERCLNKSTIAFTVLYQGIPLSMFGTIDEKHDGSACVWMITSRDIKKIRKTFYSQTRLFFNVMLEKHRELYNHVDARYMGTIEWLKRCGVTFDDKPVPYGIEQKPFYKWTLRRERWA